MWEEDNDDDEDVDDDDHQGIARSFALGASLRPLWSIPGPSWGNSGNLWGSLGASLDTFGAFFGPSWGSPGALMVVALRARLRAILEAID